MSEETTAVVVAEPDGRETHVGKDGLTWRQRRFAREYVKDFDGAAAAGRAGYRTDDVEAGLKRVAWQLVQHPAVKRAIAKACLKLEAAIEVKVEHVVAELVQVAMSDAREMFTADGSLRLPHEWPDGLAAAVSSVDVVTQQMGHGEVQHVARIRLWDKPKALETLANHLRMLRTTVEHVDRREQVFETDAELQARILKLALEADDTLRRKVIATLGESGRDG